MVELVRRYGLNLSWIVAIVATAGSLYFSEVRMFVPCNLCWWQRILMYPLAVTLGIASWFDDKVAAARYVLPISIIGMGVSAYHYAGQKFPGLIPPGVCRGGVPCDTSYINWLGFITIPLLAFTAFTLITILLSVMLSAERAHARKAAARSPAD